MTRLTKWTMWKEVVVDYRDESITSYYLTGEADDNQENVS
jgi:hypothetical protein